MKTSPVLLLFLVCNMMAPVFAQNALPIAAEPLVYRIDGAVQGCGVRLTGGRASATGRSTWFDVSFNVFRRGIALSQAIAYEFVRSDG